MKPDIEQFKPEKQAKKTVLSYRGRTHVENTSIDARAELLYASMESFYAHFSTQQWQEMIKGHAKRDIVDPERYKLVYGVIPNKGIGISYPPADGFGRFILTTRGALAHVRAEHFRGPYVEGGAVVMFDVLDTDSIDRILRRNPTMDLGYDDVGSLYINQLQRTPTDKCIPDDWDTFYASIKWENLLVHISTAYARFVGLSTVMIEPGWANEWYSIRNQDSLQLRYNATAKRCGFKRRSKESPYIKKLR